MPPLIAAAVAVQAAASAAVIGIGASVGLTAATSVAIANAIGGLALSFGGSLLQADRLPSNRLAGVALPVPDSRTPYRFNYGSRPVSGSPAAWRVKDNHAVCCFILNSRPSAGPFTVIVDKRPVTVTGDPYDFGGSGAAVQTPGILGPDDGIATRMRYWIGRGEQTSPPAQIVSEMGDDFLATDGWRGCTVIWVRCHSGGDKKRARRWPGGFPQIEVSGAWSLVWDPRNAAQDPNNPSTWAYSPNQALCVLDALRNNPIRQWSLDQLMIESFEQAATIANQSIALSAGGTAPRYRVDGQIIFQDGEVEAQVEPLLAAGASRLVNVGGRLGIVPGVWRDPVYTMTDAIGPIEYERWRSGADLPTAMQLSYVDRDGDYQLTPLPPYEPPGARVLDGQEKIETGDIRLVSWSAQAQRVQKIMALRARQQRRITTVLPPDAFNVVPGDNITVNLPAPYAAANGVYQVESANPGVWLTEDGVAMRVPVELVEHPASIYAWESSEEKPMTQQPFDPNIPDLRLPGEPTLTTGPSVALDTGGVPINRIRFVFDPSPSASADGYEWEFRVGSGDWEHGGFIDAGMTTSAGKIRGYLSFVKAGTSYDFRFRTTSGDQVSNWRNVASVVAGSAT